MGESGARAMSAGAGVASLGSIVMVWGNHTVHESSAAAARPDVESAEWLRELADRGPRREAALARLHGLLVRIARREVARRGPRLAISGPELDDLAYQAAADALLAITGKLGQFRGESRFTTWACKFVILEVSAKIGRHFWRHPAVPLDAERWMTSSPHGSGRSSSPSCSTMFRWTPWPLSWPPTATRSTKCCSMPGVSCGPLLPLMVIWATTLWGTHERLARTGPVLAD